ncbi:MAG: hypothetical protein KC609_19280 [Myxococcales bacterium]|nr:hypothetical protein [Myxococcales bacterium]
MPPKDTRVVASKGDMGVSFAFQGLATLFANGLTARNVNNTALFTVVGLEWVLMDRLHIGALFGVGINSAKAGDTRTNDWGLEVGGTLQYNVAQWKHLALFIGGNLSLGVQDPTGKNNTTLLITVAPKLGIQWFFTHMMSLSAEYLQTLTFTITDGNFSNANFVTAAGGALRLTAYF